MTEFHTKKEKNRLTAFTLRLSTKTQQEINILCALDEKFQFKYNVLDAAVLWASKNRFELLPVANPRNGKNQSAYLSGSVNEVNTDLTEYWEVNPSRALYSALTHYLLFRKEIAEA